MTKKIFRSIFAVSLLTLVCSILLIVVMLNTLFIKKVESDLESEAKLAAHAIELVGEDYFANLDTPNRITWIGEEGTVIYDSQRDASSLSNHADREEFIESK